MASRGAAQEARRAPVGGHSNDELGHPIRTSCINHPRAKLRDRPLPGGYCDDAVAAGGKASRKSSFEPSLHFVGGGLSNVSAEIRSIRQPRATSLARK